MKLIEKFDSVIYLSKSNEVLFLNSQFKAKNNSKFLQKTSTFYRKQ